MPTPPGLLLRLSRFTCGVILAVAPARGQAPLLQDGATALRQARLDWTLGQAPLPPSAMPSFEAGWGGAGGDGSYTPLLGGEGLGSSTQGWGLGLQGRYGRDGWFCSATVLALRDQGHSRGLLQRGAIGYQGPSGWRVALEQAPFAWGAGLLGGDLLGDAARSFPRLALTTAEASLPLGRWRAEAFFGRLEGERPIPAWIDAWAARSSARSAGLDLQQPSLWGGLLRASFGSWLETSLGTITLQGGKDAQGQRAPATAALTASLVEVRLRLPALAHWVQAQGASLQASRSAAPDGPTRSLAPARDLAGLHLVWGGWDCAIEYAVAPLGGTPRTFPQPTHLAGFSSHGDPLGAAFGPQTRTRSIELGLPLFLEGQGRLKALRTRAAPDPNAGTGSWFLQADAQWRTPTGRVGTSLASRRSEGLGPGGRWGWAGTVFQAFRVF